MDNLADTSRIYRRRNGEQRQWHCLKLKRKYYLRRVALAFAVVALLVIIGYVTTLGILFGANMFGDLVAGQEVILDNEIVKDASCRSCTPATSFSENLT